ncbi:MAG: DUF1648 domain-containing protein [Firmicutes bacterium]|nr:DUF1648 domain-containing protein [Bacillota bacterium]
MRRRLFHPWWVDLPGLVIIGALIAKLLALPPLPSRLAIHFDFASRPDGWGPAWTALIAMFLSLGVVFFSGVALNELWTRQERSKHFNWFALLLPPFLAFLAAVFWQIMDYWAAGSSGRLTLAWPWLVAAAAATALASAALELVRPFIPKPELPSAGTEDYPSKIAEEVARAVATNRFVYWESQDPPWLKYLVIITATAIALGGFALYGASKPAVVLYWVLSAIFFLLYGGLRITADGEWVRVRLGLSGIPLYRVRLHEISSVEIREFSPLKDFGGWGIRVNTEGTWAFFYRGSKGVLITRRDGRKVLLGSDDPARLAAVIEAARRVAGA